MHTKQFVNKTAVDYARDRYSFSIALKLRRPTQSHNCMSVNDMHVVELRKTLDDNPILTEQKLENHSDHWGTRTEVVVTCSRNLLVSCMMEWEKEKAFTVNPAWVLVLESMWIRAHQHVESQEERPDLKLTSPDEWQPQKWKAPQTSMNPSEQALLYTSERSTSTLQMHVSYK